MLDYKVIGVKELLSKPDLTPDEMAAYKIEIDVCDLEEDCCKFMEYEIQIEFMLRAAGYAPGRSKEKKRIKMLKENGKQDMIDFWKRAMK